MKSERDLHDDLNRVTSEMARRKDAEAGNKLAEALKKLIEASPASLLEKSAVLRSLADDASYEHGYADGISENEFQTRSSHEPL